MAAFTPTSVMRKMHSEKLDKENRGDVVSPQGKVPESSPEHKIRLNTTGQSNLQQNGITNNHGGMNHHDMQPQTQSQQQNQQLHHQQPDHSPQRFITGGNGNAPRALYGQGIFGQQQQQLQQSQGVAVSQQQRNPVYTVQGRPIVKGTAPEQDQNRGPLNAPPPKVNVGPQHKQFMHPNQGDS